MDGPKGWVVRCGSTASALTGPVFVELPIDVLYPYFLVQREMIPSNLPKDLMGHLVSW